MLRTIIRFGVLYGLALGIAFFASYIIIGDTPETFTTSEIVGYGIMILSSIAVFFGVLEARRNQLPDPFSFFKGLSVGLGITCISGFLFAIYNLIYLKVLNPQFTETYIAYTEDKIRSSGESNEIIQRQLEELEMYAEMMSNDFLQAGVMFMTIFLIGGMFSIASAAILKHQGEQS